MIYDVVTYRLELPPKCRIMRRANAMSYTANRVNPFLSAMLQSNAIINQRLPAQRCVTLVFARHNKGDTYPDRLYEINWQDAREP